MLYSYRCQKCNYVFDDFNRVEDRHSSTCPRCGAYAKMLFLPSAHTHVFKPYLDEHIDKKPIYIKSAKQRKDLMKKNGLQEFVQYLPGDKYLSRWI